METDERVRPNETIVPLLPCASVEETLAFWRALGFAVTYEQTRPYLYLAFEWSGFAIHYGPSHSGSDPAEGIGGCLVMVDAVAPYHAEFTAALRRAYGRVPATGLPRISRLRPGASRFTLTDPTGNSIVFIRRDEPEVHYGGDTRLTGLTRVLDNARILREFKQDDLAAFRALNSGLRKHGATAPPIERAIALACLIELSTALQDPERVREWGASLRQITLTPEERERVLTAIADPALLTDYL